MTEAPETTSPDTGALDPRWGSLSATHDPRVLAQFRPRPTDVLITTAPKAGTTWMQQILYQMRSGGDPDFENIDTVVPWLELPRRDKTWQQVLEHFDSLPDPRLFKTHCTAEQTPGVGTARVILTFRDPRDCCVSFYHHIMNLTDAAREQVGLYPPESFAAHVDNWLAFAAWYRNVKSWWPYRDHPGVLLLRFQDLKHDLPASVNRIADFLSWQLNAKQSDAVLKYSSFEWMKAHDEKFSRQVTPQERSFRPGQFIRQGKVGSYRELMTPELEEKILDRARRELEPDCLRFLEISQ